MDFRILTLLENIFEHARSNSLVYCIIRITCISNSVGSSKKHLEWNVRYAFPHGNESLPGTLMKEPQGNVKGSTTPVFEWVQIIEVMSDERGDLEKNLNLYGCCISYFCMLLYYCRYIIVTLRPWTLYQSWFLIKFQVKLIQVPKSIVVVKNNKKNNQILVGHQGTFLWTFI